jgi:preprotein translocase subunit SecF
MKIKKWLILSHVFVMVIPLIIIYFLYNTLIDYKQGMNFADYIKSSSTIEKYEHKIKNPNLYLKPPDKYKILSNKEKRNITIELYNKHGIV